MGAKSSYQKLPTRGAKLKEIIGQQFTGRIIAYGPTHEQALEQLQQICENAEYPPLMPLPGREKDGQWYCGVIRHLSMFADKWLFNTVFFGTDQSI